MEQPESDKRNEPTERVAENEEIKKEDQQENHPNGEPLLTMEVMDALLNNLEEKDKEIAMLKANEQVLNQQLQNTIEETNQLRIRLVQLSSEKQQQNSKLQEETTPSNLLRLTTNEKELMEKNASLNLSLLTVQKENSIIKKKNLRLGELIMQRDAYITTLTKEKESLVGFQEQLAVSQIEKEELQKTIRLLREEAIHHTSELQQEKAVSFALRQELTRLRQEKESLEQDYYRVENVLQKNNDELLSYQQKLSDSITRRNTLSQLLDDSKRQVHLLENQLLDANDKLTKITLNNQELELHKNHWESLTRSEIERSALMKEEYEKLKEGYKEIYIYYMNMKTDNDRLQRQCEHLASDAELARASVLTYKGTLHKNEKSFDELLKENVYLSTMLKQKEGQLEEVEQYWKKQFKDVLNQELKEEKPAPNSIPPFVPSPINQDKGGYSYPLPSNHPFVSTPPNGIATPQRATVPNVVKSSSTKSTPTTSTLPTQSLSGLSPVSSAVQTSFTSASFESLLNDVIKQTEELRKISDYYESQ